MAFSSETQTLDRAELSLLSSYWPSIYYSQPPPIYGIESNNNIIAVENVRLEREEEDTLNCSESNKFAILKSSLDEECLQNLILGHRSQRRRRSIVREGRQGRLRRMWWFETKEDAILDMEQMQSFPRRSSSSTR